MGGFARLVWRGESRHEEENEKIMTMETLRFTISRYGKKPYTVRVSGFEDDELIQIGSKKLSHVLLEDPRIAPLHAVLRKSTDGYGHWWFIDLGSSEGSFVRGGRVWQRAKVSSGDVLAFGPFDVKFEIGEAVPSRFPGSGVPEELAGDTTPAMRARAKAWAVAIYGDSCSQDVAAYSYLIGLRDAGRGAERLGPGDAVRLAGAGPQMTVEKVVRDVEVDTLEVVCQWLTGMKGQRARFLYDDLEKVP